MRRTRHGRHLPCGSNANVKTARYFRQNAGNDKIVGTEREHA